jgi:hypothetical protein
MALPPALNPYTQAHYDQLMEALRNIGNYRTLAAHAQAAGMDTAAHDQLATHLENKLNGIRTQFFPAGRPKP